MSCFPIFIDLQNKNILIVGGGKVALRKAEKLLPYGPVITVIAESFAEDFHPLAENNASFLLLRSGSFDDADLETADLVIAATDDRTLNAHISCLCRERKIPVNVVDDAELCTFLFPSLVKRGDLSVGISTGGASPAAAIYTRKLIENALPDGMEEIISYLASLRPIIMETVPDPGTRHLLFHTMFEKCFLKNTSLTEDELRNLLKNMPLTEDESRDILTRMN